MKVLVIGIDGASPTLIERWIEELPTFRKIRDEECFGLSVPPTPAQTPVAWTTFMTGKNPGKHGIFSFMMREKGTYERQVAQPSMIQARTLWDLLSEAGKRVGIVNVPISGVEEINGFIIPGFLSRTEGVPHPQSIKSRIRDELGIERLAGDVDTATLQNAEQKPIKFFESVNKITDETAQISRFLVEKEAWDFFMTVFMGADRIQHFFWKYVDPAHEKYNKNQFTQMVKAYYIKLDSILRSFLKLVDKETLVLVLSDHGFCPVNKEIVLNNYLEELGVLQLRKDSLDLENSKAISYGYGDIWLNVKGREPHGLVNVGGNYEETRNSIIKGLKSLRIDGEHPFKDVKRNDEIYWGDRFSESPDLIAICNIGWQVARRPVIMKKRDTQTYVNPEPRWSGGHDGAHDPLDVPGIFGVINSKENCLRNIKLNLWDLAPTILDFMGVPIPEDMDGKPMRARDV